MTNNLENKKFGRLTPLHIVEIPKYTKGPVWLFKCDCGKEKEILYRSVIKGDTKSCGCLRRELMKDNKLGKYCIKHGMSRTRYYRIWVDMKSRCLNNLHESFAHYGGRGIKVCEEWDNFTGFMEDTYKSYLEHIEEHGKRETTLERKNVDEGYNVLNYSWATWKEQAINKRTTRTFIAISPENTEYTYNNQKQFAKDHDLIGGCINNCLRNKHRTHKGWTFRYTEIDMYKSEEELIKAIKEPN